MERSQTVLYCIKALSNKIKHLLENVSTELTGMQHAVIYFISDTSRQSEYFQKDIEMEFNISRSTASGILKRMEKNGLLIRTAAKGDARLKKIILTEKAYGINQPVKNVINGLENKAVAGLTKEELATFFKVVEKISLNLTEI